MNRDSGPLSIIVVSHTHWDREWYHTAARFRQRLIPLIDELLARPPDEPPFLLDGQAIVLEDYLRVRPLARDTLARALRAGQLEAGPWYVLADELIPGGEALVRNLLAGRRTLAELGAAPPPVLYSPDAFGHPAALPLIAREFGLSLVVLWRGLGGPQWPPGDTFQWIGPDASSVIVHHLPPDGYEFGSSLPADADGARVRWQELSAVLGPRARLGAVLLLNGADHHAPQTDLAAAVSALADAAAPDLVRRAGLRAAALTLAGEARGCELPEIHGELRNSAGYTWSLQGTFAVRAHLKRAAVCLERTLVRDVEPWLALGHHLTGTPALALEHAAWKTLLECHPHDTLCGCSIDAVARAMEGRLESGGIEAAGLRTDALHAVLGHDPDQAIGARARWKPAVVVRNAAARPRSGVAELSLLAFSRDVPVGPGSAFAAPPVTPDEPLVIDGGRVPYQLLAEGVRHDRLEPRRRYPDADLVHEKRVAAWVTGVPAYGITTLGITPGASPAPSGAVRTGMSPGAGPWMENEWLRVSCEADGSVTLSTRDGARHVPSLLAIEDAGDVGDTYTPSLIAPVLHETASRGARLMHRGPLRGLITARYDLAAPAASTREGRSGDTVTLPIAVRLTLDTGTPFLRVHVTGNNTARDHRLRVLFATGIVGGEEWADAAFGPVRRIPAAASPDEAVREQPLPTAPLHRYVTIANDAGGATLFSDGATEYEVLPDGRIAVSVFRAVGELSRSDLPERPGHAGWPAETPGAQCAGPFETGFAVLLHGPRTDDVIDHIERCADDVLFPLRGETIRALLALPEPRPGFELEGAGLAFGACKRSEDGAWVVLRCVNLLARDVQGSWRLPAGVAEARLSRLDEDVGDSLAVTDGRVVFSAPSRAAVTILVR